MQWEKCCIHCAISSFCNKTVDFHEEHFTLNFIKRVAEISMKFLLLLLTSKSLKRSRSIIRGYGKIIDAYGNLFQLN